VLCSLAWLLATEEWSYFGCGLSKDWITSSKREDDEVIVLVSTKKLGRPELYSFSFIHSEDELKWRLDYIFCCTYFWKQYFRNYVPSIVFQYMELGYSIWVNLIFSILNWFIMIPVLSFNPQIWTSKSQLALLGISQCWEWVVYSAVSFVANSSGLRTACALSRPATTWHACNYIFIYILWIFY
jgi:hypothetical protein